MAIRVYDAGWGYARWYAWRAYSSDESPYLVGPFQPAALAIPVRPQGVLLWRGRMESPIWARDDARWQAVRTLMESLDQGVHQIRLTVPMDQRTALLGAEIVGQPVRIDPAVRGSRGEVRGWQVEWVEVP